ncbi:MAPEG family protein [Sphingorhabdus sp. Alg239-R122]|uniref:MAPEG family protein n=1 Tax=Sphingorhabdus sp. Alg239-R122 TaxID=2305989 RepID=UPI0013DAA67B|nr:MAPEG family protein [Sphingorhabdus sp. Alg239-R122]
MTMPLITATAAGVIIILQVILMITVGLHRAKTGISVGTGEDRDMERKMRRHGNLAENSGLFIAALALLEIVGASRPLVLGLAVTFIIGRLAHVFAFSSLVGSHNEPGGMIFTVGRGVGALATFGTGMVIGVSLLIYTL